MALIAYDWSTRIMGGSVRAIAFARHLPDHGWSPVVVTSSPPDEWPDMPIGVDAVHIPSRERTFGGGITGDANDATLGGNPPWLRRLAALKRVLPLERQLVWFPAFARRAPRAVDGVEAVVTVTAPYVMLLAGHWLAHRLGVPHLVDLRDDWRDRALVEPLPAAYRRILDWYATAVVRRAAGLTVVSPRTRDRFAAEGIGASLVMNGYDEPAFSTIPWEAGTVAPTGPLRVVHLGWLGDFRSIGPVLAAIRDLCGDGAASPDDFRVEHYGLIEPGQARLLTDSPPCPTEIHGQIPHGQAVRVMQGADVLLAIPGDRIPAAVSGKLFEYLRARRPILLVAGEGAARDVATKVGVPHVVAPSDAPGMRRALGELLAAKREGRLAARSAEDAVRSLDRRHGVAGLANLLDEVTQ